MAKALQEINAFLTRVLEIAGFHGTVIFIFDVNSDRKEVHLKTKVYPLIEI